IRAKVFRALIDAKGPLTTSGVVMLLRCSAPTARKEMEALVVLGIAKKGTSKKQDEAEGPEEKIALKKRFEWIASAECKALQASMALQGGNLFKIPAGIKKEFPPCETLEGAGQPAGSPQKPMTPGKFLAEATTLFNATPAKDDGTETP